jgi:hypothetical protein
MRRDYLDCSTCGGRVEVFTRPGPAEHGRELTATCHGVWFVDYAASDIPTREETVAFLLKATQLPKKGAA